MTPLKDHSNLVAKPKDVEIYGLPDEEFKIAVLRKLRATRKHRNNSMISGKHKNKIRKLTKIEIIKKRNILELKNSVYEMKI